MKITQQKIKNTSQKLKFKYNKNLKKKTILLYKSNTILFKTKKKLNLIHKYHIKKKRILFAELPFFFFKKFTFLFKALKSKHLCISKRAWVNGLLTNTTTCFYSQLKKKINKNLNFFLHFNKKIDLIVILTKTTAETQVLKESFSNNLPVIILNFKESLSQKNSNFYYLKTNKNTARKHNTLNSFLFNILKKPSNTTLCTRVNNNKIKKTSLKLNKKYAKFFKRKFKKLHIIKKNKKFFQKFFFYLKKKKTKKC